MGHRDEPALLHGQSDEMVLADDVLDYHPGEQRGTAEWR